MKIKLFIILLVSLFLVGCLPSDRVHSTSNEFKVVDVYKMEEFPNTKQYPYDYIYIVRDGSQDGRFTLYSDVAYSVGDIISFEIKESTPPILENE